MEFKILFRKGSLLACALLFMISAVMFAMCRLAKSVEMILLARLLSGFGSGLATSVAPMYVSEIAPLHLRGPLATLFSLSIAFGIVFGGVVSLEETLGTPTLWHYSFCVYAVVVLVFLLFFPLFPESPKYLYIIAGKKDKALDGRFYIIFYFVCGRYYFIMHSMNYKEPLKTERSGSLFKFQFSI